MKTLCIAACCAALAACASMGGSEPLDTTYVASADAR